MAVKELESRFLMNLEISYEPPVVVTPGTVVINVTGGSFFGPRLQGKVIAPSGDWARLQANGNWKIDARVAVKTDDGESAYVYYHGVVAMTDELAQRSAAGEVLTNNDLYFRIAPNFDTASEKYGWLNDILAVGRMKEFGAGKLSYDIFELI